MEWVVITLTTEHTKKKKKQKKTTYDIGNPRLLGTDTQKRQS